MNLKLPILGLLGADTGRCTMSAHVKECLWCEPSGIPEVGERWLAVERMLSCQAHLALIAGHPGVGRASVDA